MLVRGMRSAPEILYFAQRSLSKTHPLLLLWRLLPWLI